MKPEAFEFFESLYRSEYKKMVASAKSRLRNLQSAEDIVQDTYIVALSKIDELMLKPNPRAWLYVVLQNKIKHEYRAKARFMVMWEKIERNVLEQQIREEGSWKDVLEGLPDSDYDLLKLVYIEGCSNREVAEMKDMSYDACRKAIQRAKDRVRKRQN